ncbi:Dipeptidyl aminopeptidase/acylaminoacyl peptidase [Mucilaginibacter lappiensis]|uniref:Dipeptidyl aminopeptidase/acylaminoacyl peptidase n=1 Tax=Mucilaginibacter lappiensis TaxID=354630 RepID=A0ABR6PKK7_9SPHI|nr:prolyl oligopeptidase family serine peptidase [Mucilaginibacter lappiensis]MBB6110306.1 dipeptidyl aminopeptidase/acylaminoacyl peptidase [Mucilaginibacter lappiensis]SIR29917.1 Dipeptidyl aminopeptidase/acylaminoacyl peptidase [Mucilaginibacter lappiensis]
MKKLITLLLIANTAGAFAQKLDTLTVEKIMRDPKWVGVSPSNIRWSDDSKKIYFKWNPGHDDADVLYAIAIGNTNPQKVSIAGQRGLTTDGEWNKSHTQKVFEKNGDLFLADIKSGKVIQLTNTEQREDDPIFNGDEREIIFKQNNNLFALSLNGGQLKQLTNFVRSPEKKKDEEKLNDEQSWLKKQQLELFDIIKKEAKEDKQDSAQTAALEPRQLKELVTGGDRVGLVKISPDGKYVTYRLTKAADGVKNAIVPNYVTASGFTEDIPNRSKVGRPSSTSKMLVFDTRRQAVYPVLTQDIPGIKDLPDYVKDYPTELAERKKANADRQVDIEGPFWSADGKNAVVVISAQDNKDRWIMRLDPVTGKLALLDRQRDEAWIGGPGIETGAAGNVGFTDDTHFYFQSEASGYSHIYLVDVTSGAKKQLTSGKWEVQTLQLSNDKKTFYFTANIDHPGITHFYSIPVSGGKSVKITEMKGGNEVTLSPDEKWLAIRYSYSNKPWELYLQANKPGAKAVQVTHSVSAEFNSYAWRDPEIITFKNRYGADVYARQYLPKKADPAKPAVIFVHGAGYLQEVTYSWSYYFREYMFNNMLADNGYTVLDIDYTASAGYGRDWRTGIYRHMGGKDLTDQVDGVKYLVEKFGVNPKHVGLYGGSYGGFITLMGMFTEPNVFAAGGAIRSVTDWAHYNHGYTSNILNEPFTDEQAYRKSSPIYFANGLKGNLLMLHGMIDQNVNYQDIIRLTQKLIELHKENWELASYPVEDHGFEQPSSWSDEYKRIFKLFEQTLKK